MFCVALVVGVASCLRNPRPRLGQKRVNREPVCVLFTSMFSYRFVDCELCSVNCGTRFLERWVSCVAVLFDRHVLTALAREPPGF